MHYFFEMITLVGFSDYPENLLGYCVVENSKMKRKD